MSVIIENMGLPSDCLKCKFCVESGECAALDPGTFVCDYKDKRPEFCPLRPLEAVSSHADFTHNGIAILEEIAKTIMEGNK